MDVVGFTSPTGLDLKDSPEILSKYQEALGKEVVENDLNDLAEDPKSWTDIEQLQEWKKFKHLPEAQDVRSWDNPTAKKIERIMTKASQRAWAKIQRDPAIQKLIEDKRRAQKGKRDTQNPGRNPTQELLVPTR